MQHISTSLHPPVCCRALTTNVPPLATRRMGIGGAEALWVHTPPHHRRLQLMAPPRAAHTDKTVAPLGAQHTQHHASHRSTPWRPPRSTSATQHLSALWRPPRSTAGTRHFNAPCRQPHSTQGSQNLTAPWRQTRSTLAPRRPLAAAMRHISDSAPHQSLVACQDWQKRVSAPSSPPVAEHSTRTSLV